MITDLTIALNTKRLWGWRPSPIVRISRRHKVSFVVIGGVAVSYYTRGRYAPDDLDILISDDDEHIARSMRAVEEIVLTIPLIKPLPLFGTVELRSGHSLVVDTEAARLDVVGYDLGVGRCQLLQNSRSVILDGAVTPLCSRLDLIALKRYNPREKDADHLALLELRD